ncbi:hypothetical protein ID867_09550 [Streptomyces parvulus]|nr:hypothetical protein [Streptomyces parvulus]
MHQQSAVVVHGAVDDSDVSDADDRVRGDRGADALAVTQVDHLEGRAVQVTVGEDGEAPVAGERGGGPVPRSAVECSFEVDLVEQAGVGGVVPQQPGLLVQCDVPRLEGVLGAVLGGQGDREERAFGVLAVPDRDRLPGDADEEAAEGAEAQGRALVAHLGELLGALQVVHVREDPCSTAR